MIKKIFFISMLSCSLFISGCTAVKDIPLENILDNITNEANLDNMEKGDNKALKRYFGLNPSDLEDFIIYTPAYTMDVDELLIIKVKDESMTDSIEEVIESRVDKQIELFGTYGPNQCELLEDYELKIIDNYIFYVVSENAEDITNAFKASIK